MSTNFNIDKNKKIINMIDVIISKYNQKFHDDLKQELFLKTLELINNNIKTKSFESYLFVALKNHAYKYVKQETKQNDYIEYDDNIKYNPYINSFEYLLLTNLTKLEQYVFVMHFIYGYTKKEISINLKTYPKKVCSIINKIKKNKNFSSFYFALHTIVQFVISL